VAYSFNCRIKNEGLPKKCKGDYISETVQDEILLWHTTNKKWYTAYL